MSSRSAPAPGGLTRALLATGAADVVAVEIDPRAVAAIAELAAGEPRLRVIAGDALAMDLASLCPPPRHIVANLPYNVATPAADRLARPGGGVRGDDLDVPAGGGRAHLCRARYTGIRPALGAGAMDLRGGARFAAAARGVRSGARRVVGRRAPVATLHTARAGVVLGDATTDGGRVRAAPQDAARFAAASGAAKRCWTAQQSRPTGGRKR